MEQQDQHHSSNYNADSFDRILKILSNKQVQKFHKDGYLFLENIFPPDVIENAVLAANELWPEYDATPSISPKFFSFPFEDAWLNEITLHPNLLAIMCQLLQVHPSDLDDPRPSLYSKERKVAYRKGSMLLFQLGTWHRGTPVIHGRLRRIHHLCFRKAAATWIGSAPEFGQPTLTTSLAHHSNILDRPYCKTILGFNAENKNAL